jgi:hypothetical protein
MLIPALVGNKIVAPDTPEVALFTVKLKFDPVVFISVTNLQHSAGKAVSEPDRVRVLDTSAGSSVLEAICLRRLACSLSKSLFSIIIFSLI